MNNAVVYSLLWLVHDLADTLRHWYVDSFRIIGRLTISLLERLDRRLALKITLRYFFKPLYGDRSIPGRFFAFIFRTIRVFIALILYSVIICFALGSYVIFALLPVFVIYLGLR